MPIMLSHLFLICHLSHLCFYTIHVPFLDKHIERLFRILSVFSFIIALIPAFGTYIHFSWQGLEHILLTNWLIQNCIISLSLEADLI